MYLTELWNSFITKAKKNGSYTEFDAMKLFAIVNMTIDHIGAYFFPDDMWWRTLGRITFPVWFFLVGYSRSRSLSKEVWLYALILVANHLVVGRAILPINALGSVILCRMMLNTCHRYNLLPQKLPEITTFFVVIILFTFPLFEYGSMAFLFAIFGWMVRENQKEHFTAVMVASYLAFIVFQLLSFHFNMIESIYVIMGTAWVVKRLAGPQDRAIWTSASWENSHFKTLITVLSRNTLFYYFIHRMIFEITANIIYHKNMWFSVKLL